MLLIEHSKSRYKFQVKYKKENYRVRHKKQQNEWILILGECP